MGRRGSVELLPRAVREWLDRSLMEGNFSGYQALEDALRERGCQVSKSAIHRYGQKIERRFAAIKASTEAARMLTEGSSDDRDARSEAIIALVQTELFETIVNLQEAEDAQDQAERVKLLSNAATNIATLSRASVNLKQFQASVRAEERKLAASTAANEARAAGLSDEAAQIIRQKILGVA